MANAFAYGVAALAVICLVRLFTFDVTSRSSSRRSGANDGGGAFLTAASSGSVGDLVTLLVVYFSPDALAVAEKIVAVFGS